MVIIAMSLRGSLRGDATTFNSLAPCLRSPSLPQSMSVECPHIVSVEIAQVWEEKGENHQNNLPVCYRLNVCASSSSKCWSPNLQDAGFCRWVLGEVIRISWGQEGGAPMMGLSTRQEEEEPMFVLSLLCEDTARREPWEEEGSHQTPNLQVLWSWTSSPHNCEK